MSAPEWHYEDYPQHRMLLRKRERKILTSLQEGSVDRIGTCQDSRPIHHEFFVGLTPRKMPHFAGHYRGENYPYLKFYDVQIIGDPSVGTQAQHVAGELAEFSAAIDQAHEFMLQANRLPEARLSKADWMMYLVALLCELFVEFLRIHPYADGNGHIARYLVFAFLGENGVWPKSWPLNDRPQDPPYSQLIAAYRGGDKSGLQRFLLRAIVGDP